MLLEMFSSVMREEANEIGNVYTVHILLNNRHEGRSNVTKV